MRRLLLVVLGLTAAVVVLLPLYFWAFPVETPRLPPPGPRFAVADGLAVNAVEKGNGPPIVLIHGLPGCAYDWTPLTDALAGRGFHVIAYDRIGYGYSDARPDDAFTIASNARELLGLLERQDLHDVTLVGHSYGGPVAIEAAGRDASRIARLVLIASAGPPEAGGEPPPAIFRLLLSGPGLAWLHAVPPAGRAVQAAMSRDAFAGEPEPAWWLPQLAANMEAPHTLRSFAEEEAHIGAGDAAIDPLTVPRPILLFHGDHDRLVPLSVGQWLKAHARDAELVVIRNGSHMLPITHTRELADRIASFAQARPSEAPPATSSVGD